MNTDRVKAVEKIQKKDPNCPLIYAVHWALAFRHRNGFGDRVSALTVQVRVQMRSREFMSLERYSLVGGGRFPEVSTCATRADEPPHTAIHHQTDHCR